MSLQLAIAVGGTGQAVEGVIGDVELHHALAELGELVRLGRDDHAVLGRRGAGGRVPRRPSISTRQRRQEPKASSESVAQSLGICVPACIAAAITEVPAGTVTLMPSMVERDGLLVHPDRGARNRSL